jgi:7-cyano-7-deazaguanine synthase
MAPFKSGSTITRMKPSAAATAPGLRAQLPSDLTALAVLASGGLDSAILLGQALQHQAAVQPLYIRSGLFWETAELAHLRRFLEHIACPALRPLVVLDLPVRDLYGAHWSITGQEVPDALSPDEAVFLPGRNVLLLAKALLWCHLHSIGAVALATLQGNPFPDATPAFFASFGEIVNEAVNGRIRIVSPFAGLHKVDVMRLGQDLPLEWTFSCIRPVAGRHCGRCNKCAERREAFAAAALVDRTT